MATPNDQAVLQTIFNPTTPFGDVPGLDDNEDQVQDDDQDFDSDLLANAKELEQQGVLAAESGDITRAIEKFSLAIQTLPERASGYNNRAQALRLQGDTAGALQDLNRALDLSGEMGQTACQAFVQRGLIYRLQEQDEAARKDFTRGVQLGSNFAKHQLVLMNPYAALCNRMLTSMILKLRNPDV
ncbi:tetratricopeptide repeat protein 36 [Microcaecilia unicolor]|uniref:Tetratricopeptide repeat protein 36 n=1 Tax=Microcaecilia unicolor TaxID=1415580 RepID=A0A6P7ZD83_9AMPH|nr:tetratricopeptide repeat protein 36 [Microcaecilia unicolor]